MSKDIISRITDKVIAEMVEWQNRPLDPGRFPVIVANPELKGSRCHGEAYNKAPVETKRRYFALIRQGASGAQASSQVGCR